MERCMDCNSLLTKEEKVDRKSTRLNSSHSQISYAVFCLKKKKTIRIRSPTAQRGITDASEPRGRVQVTLLKTHSVDPTAHAEAAFVRRTIDPVPPDLIR